MLGKVIGLVGFSGGHWILNCPCWKQSWTHQNCMSIALVCLGKGGALAPARMA